MKLHFICLSSFILLFSNCSRSGFVIKKRYSKGFYVAHSSKVKTELLIFYPEKEIAKTEDQLIAKKPRENDVAMSNFSEIPSHDIPLNSVTSLNKILYEHVSSKSSVSQKFPMYHNGNRVNDTVAASVGMLVVLITILALVKTFGLIFTLPVCFVIAFTAIAIFFMIRNHVKD